MQKPDVWCRCNKKGKKIKAKGPCDGKKDFCAWNTDECRPKKEKSPAAPEKESVTPAPEKESSTPSSAPPAAPAKTDGAKTDGWGENAKWAGGQPIAPLEKKVTGQ